MTPNEPPKTEAELLALAAQVEQSYDADLMIYFGPVARNWDDHLIDACRARTRRTNVLLMLTTLGGDAHAAYRIARCLQQNYSKNHREGRGKGEVFIFVNSVCASAGTLITLAAHKLIISDHAELGPLDVQIRKSDEVGERTSGLTPIQALNFLEGESIKFFKAQFEGLRFSRRLAFSTRMAADISAQMASGLVSRLYEQIDPLRLAEYDRLMRIAAEYGERIKTANVKSNSIDSLLNGYPSHEFCIDPTEARELFNNVERPSDELELLGSYLKNIAEKHLYGDNAAVFYLTPNTPLKGEIHEAPPARPDTTKLPKPHRGNGRRKEGSPKRTGKPSGASKTAANITR